MAEFTGFCTLGDTFKPCFLTRSGNTPLNASALPTYRVYAGDGTVKLSGSAAFKDSGSLTGATNATPIVCTDVAHGLTTGTRVTITGALGNTAANGTWVITRLTADTFSLDTSVGNGAWTSGGIWNVTGMYSLELAVTAGNGFDVNEVYTVVISATVNSAAYGAALCFGVV